MIGRGTPSFGCGRGEITKEMERVTKVWLHNRDTHKEWERVTLMGWWDGDTPNEDMV